MKKLSLILGMTLMSSFAMAQQSSSSETTSTVEKSQVVPADKQVKDIDEEITNAKMRAETGAKSKYSLRTALSYSGGSVQNPFDKVRPNYRGAGNTTTSTALGGSIAMKYRATERDNISVGIGVAIKTPFHNSSTQEFNDNTTISDPYVGYDRLYKVGDYQMVSSASLSFVTDSETIREFRELADTSLSQTAIYSFNSGWDVGLSVMLGNRFYRDSDLDNRVSVNLGLYPFAEYAFNDTFQFRTVFGYFNYESRRSAPLSLNSKTPYQSMGISIVLTRDIYLYPNIQFVPTDIRADRTNVALTTYISL